MAVWDVSLYLQVHGEHREGSKGEKQVDGISQKPFPPVGIKQRQGTEILQISGGNMANSYWVFGPTWSHLCSYSGNVR